MNKFAETLNTHLAQLRDAADRWQSRALIELGRPSAHATARAVAIIERVFGVEPRLRLGLWEPGDPLPDSLIEMLTYMKAKGVKPVVFKPVFLCIF